MAKLTVNEPEAYRHERALMILLGGVLEHWSSAMLIVRPETVLRWHRYGFRLLWRRRSRARRSKPRVATEMVQLIRRLATENRLWGAERVRGEPLRLGIHLPKRASEMNAFSGASGASAWITRSRAASVITMPVLSGLHPGDSVADEPSSQDRPQPNVGHRTIGVSPLIAVG